MRRTPPAAMRHFAQLCPEQTSRLFSHAPRTFTRESDPATLAVALGATLYAPATRPTLAADVARRAAAGVTSMVLDLEDAVADDQVRAGEANLVTQLRRHNDSGASSPLLFVRVRTPEQIVDLSDRLGTDTSALSGFVMPKFTADNGPDYLHALAAAERASGTRLFAMPVLESPEIVYRETRKESLVAAHRLIQRNQEKVLAVRIGATDLSSAYGLRRPRDLTIWDIQVVAEVLSDIVNIFTRADGTGHVVTGCVWEYFGGSTNLFKPQLRQSIFEGHTGRGLRQELISAGMDGLIREVHQDQANGLQGKTVIHPDHVAAVNALSVVSHEEFSDATAIVGDDVAAGGVMASAFRNKMNEVKPHRAWARKVLARANVFGVAAPETNFVSLLEACQAAESAQPAA